MRVAVLFNPIAGAGKAARAAAEIEDALTADGLKPVMFESQPHGLPAELEASLPEAGALVVVGGDGTVRTAAEAALGAGTPIYQFPFGTENLFAREFRMRRDLGMLRRALASMDVTEIDVARANGELFLMMVSVGFDAEVIHDLASTRRGAITHLTYIGPMLRQALRWKPAAVRVTVDGEPVDPLQPGITIVANARQYAFRLDPIPHASVHDGLVHLAHIPVRSKLAIPILAMRARMRRQAHDPRIVQASGRRIVVEYDSPQRFQIDGDAASRDADRIEVAAQPAALRVLRPSG